MKPKLAIHGGTPLITREVPRYNSIGREEAERVSEVMESGLLSGFLGAWSEDFFGGPFVRDFESRAADYFGVKHVLSVNSWTSGLIAGLGAIGINPGDEVIVSPFTMAASATAILHWGALPVFADVDRSDYCIDPTSVESLIGPHTRAIVAVDIFGHPSQSEQLMALAKKRNLRVFTDSAQAPGAKVGTQFAGTLTDLGGYSLNHHKHINTGEGGLVVTNDDEIAENVALIRNHAEAVVGGMGKRDIKNMVGYNFRMGEIEAAIGLAQLTKLSRAVFSRQQMASILTAELEKLSGIQVPKIRPGYTHSFYIYPMTLDPKSTGVKRDKIVAALRAEGVPGLIEGYANIHLLPIFQKKIAFGDEGFPWSLYPDRVANGYLKGIVPVAEDLFENGFLGLLMCMYDFTESDMSDIAEAFSKVWANLETLQ